MSAPYPQVLVESREQWRSWLQANAGSSTGIWLVTWKKGRGPYVGYDDVVDQALCFGWVDSQPRSVDDARSSRLLTPRRPGSSWSRVNKQRVQRLQSAGLMTPAGTAAVETAKEDGSWAALDDVEELREPSDLTAALDDLPAARRQWDTFPRSTKRAILEWISTAKTDNTRTRRVQSTAQEANVGRRANQWRQPGAGAPKPEP